MRATELDLNLLHAFEAIMAERSVTGAARRLGLRQPALSAALARLRAAFDDPLFVRSGTAMQPTARAEAIAPSLAEALGLIRTTLETAAPFRPATATRRFRIAAADYLAGVLLPPLLAGWAQAAPGLELDIIAADKPDVAALLERGSLDLALGVFAPPPARMVRGTLFTDQFLGVARPGHPLLEAPVTLDRLLDWPHALVTLARDRRGALDTALAALGRRRRIGLTLPHMLALPAALAASDLLAVLPERLLQALAGPPLARFDLPLALPPFEIAMLWNPAARGDPALAWLRAQLVAAAAPRAAGTGEAR